MYTPCFENCIDVPIFSKRTDVKKWRVLNMKDVWDILRECKLYLLVWSKTIIFATTTENSIDQQ